MKFKVFGLPRSGTNYLKELLLLNFEDLNIEEKYGKHRFNCDQLEHDCLNIVIFKNPYKWLESILITNTSRYDYSEDSIGLNLVINDVRYGAIKYDTLKREECYAKKYKTGITLYYNHHNLIEVWKKYYIKWSENESLIKLHYKDLLQDEKIFLTKIQNDFNLKKKNKYWLNVRNFSSVENSENFSSLKIDEYLDESKLYYLDYKYLDVINEVLDVEWLSENTPYSPIYR
jgi:hypothetical protein